MSGRSSPHSTYYMGQKFIRGSIHSSLEPEKGKDSEPKQDDTRKSFLMKRGDVIDYSSSGVSTNDASPLDPITEEDENPISQAVSFSQARSPQKGQVSSRQT